MSIGYRAIAIGGVSLDLRFLRALGTDARHFSLVKSERRNALGRIAKDGRFATGQISAGCFTAVGSAKGQIIPEPLDAGSGDAITDIDLALIHSRKRLMDARGRNGPLELIALLNGRTLAPHIYKRAAQPLYRPTVASPKLGDKAQIPEGLHR